MTNNVRRKLLLGAAAGVAIAGTGASLFLRKPKAPASAATYRIRASR